MRGSVPVYSARTPSTCTCLHAPVLSEHADGARRRSTTEHADGAHGEPCARRMRHAVHGMPLACYASKLLARRGASTLLRTEHICIASDVVRGPSAARCSCALVLIMSAGCVITVATNAHAVPAAGRAGDRRPHRD